MRNEITQEEKELMEKENKKIEFLIKFAFWCVYFATIIFLYMYHLLLEMESSL